jgi:hypothetical protein
MTDAERESAEAVLAERLLADKLDLMYLARELGFPDYTRIHEAVKPILADYVARMMVRYRFEIIKIVEAQQSKK